MPVRSGITGTGMALPECVVDNHLLSRCMSTSDEWIVQRSGIRERRVSPDTYRMLLRLAEAPDKQAYRSEEHTSELQSLRHLVCRLLLEKKKKTQIRSAIDTYY